MDAVYDFYMIFIRTYNKLDKKLIWGTHKDLYAYIGYIYLNSTEKIDSINYVKVYNSEILKTFDRYYYIVNCGALCMEVLTGHEVVEGGD